MQINRRSFETHLDEAALRALRASCNFLHDDPLQDLADADPDLLARTELLVTGWGSAPIDARLRAAMPRLKLIAHLGGTVKHLVTPEVMQSGVRVTQAAAANARPVAQFCLAMILLHNKGVADWARLYAERRSAMRVKADPLHARVGNRGKVVGIVGASRVGRCLIDYLKPHGLPVLLHDPYLSEAEARALEVDLVPLDRLLSESDVVSLHQPLLPSTRGSFGARDFALMRDGALFMNTARGAIVDQPAMIEALAGGRLNAVLDVTFPEPLPDDCPLWDMPNVLLTPHVAGSLGTEVFEMTEMVIEEIRRFTRGEPLQHEVTTEIWERVA
jgi:phosphoglycerate dehydrogenase-like enzyme